MKLAELKENNVAKIIKFDDAPLVIERLNNVGLHVGQEIRLVKFAPFKGPVLVQDLQSGAQIVIAKSIATHIEVKVVSLHET